MEGGLVELVIGFVSLRRMWNQFARPRESREQGDATPPVPTQGRATRTISRALVIVLGLFLLAYAATMVINPIPWLSGEQFSLRSGQQIIGYQVSDNGNTTTILEDSPRQLRIVSDEEIQKRTICLVSDEFTFASEYRLINEPLFSPQVQLPKCAIPLSRRPVSIKRLSAR